MEGRGSILECFITVLKVIYCFDIKHLMVCTILSQIKEVTWFCSKSSINPLNMHSTKTGMTVFDKYMQSWYLGFFNCGLCMLYTYTGSALLIYWTLKIDILWRSCWRSLALREVVFKRLIINDMFIASSYHLDYFCFEMSMHEANYTESAASWRSWQTIYSRVIILFQLFLTQNMSIT
jgi:hypothetical protein